MFANNEQIHKRLNKDSVMYIPYLNDTRTFKQVIEIMFSCPDGFSITEFCDMYEFIYDSRRNWLLFIVRDARLRLRKYFYLPPIYVAFDLSKDFSNWKPAEIRYYMKFAPISYQLEQDADYAYSLTEHPYMVAYHPHIDASANACYGRWHRQLEDQCYTGFETMDTLRGFLNDYNGRSTFFNIDPYKHDKGAPAKRAGSYPYANRRMCSSNLPAYWEHTKKMMTTHFGDDWLDDFCEHSGLNRKIMESFDFFYLQGSQESNGYKSWRETLHILIGSDEELAKQFEYYMIPESMHYQDEGYDDACSKRNKYFENTMMYETPRVRRALTQFFMKDCYDYTSGDVDSIIKGFNNWGNVNLSYNPNLLKIHREVMDMRDSGSSYSINSILHTFASVTLDSRGRNCDNPKLNMLSLLNNNTDLPNMALNSLMFEFHAKKSLDRVEYVVAYKSLRTARDHDWAYLESLGIEGTGLSMDGDAVTSEGGNWYWHAKEHGMEQGCLFNEIINSMRYSAKRLIERVAPCPIDLQKYFIHHLRDEVACNGNIDWSKEFNKDNKIEPEVVWNDILFKTLTDYGVVENYGSRLNEWARDYIYERFHTNDNDMELAEKWFLSGPSVLQNATDEEKKEVIDFFYITFPTFMKNLEECYEHRKDFDREAINKATSNFLARCDKLRKGYKNVFANTLPSVEQGELFSQQVSV